MGICVSKQECNRLVYCANDPAGCRLAPAGDHASYLESDVSTLAAHGGHGDLIATEMCEDHLSSNYNLIFDEWGGTYLESGGRKWQYVVTTKCDTSRDDPNRVAQFYCKEVSYGAMPHELSSEYPSPSPPSLPLSSIQKVLWQSQLDLHPGGDFRTGSPSSLSSIESTLRKGLPQWGDPAMDAISSGYGGRWIQIVAADGPQQWRSPQGWQDMASSKSEKQKSVMTSQGAEGRITNTPASFGDLHPVTATGPGPLMEMVGKAGEIGVFGAERYFNASTEQQSRLDGNVARPVGDQSHGDLPIAAAGDKSCHGDLPAAVERVPSVLSSAGGSDMQRDASGPNYQYRNSTAASSDVSYDSRSALSGAGKIASSDAMWSSTSPSYSRNNSDKKGSTRASGKHKIPSALTDMSAVGCIWSLCAGSKTVDTMDEAQLASTRANRSSNLKVQDRVKLDFSHSSSSHGDVLPASPATYEYPRSPTVPSSSSNIKLEDLHQPPSPLHVQAASRHRLGQQSGSLPSSSADRRPASMVAWHPKCRVALSSCENPGSMVGCHPKCAAGSTCRSASRSNISVDSSLHDHQASSYGRSSTTVIHRQKMNATALHMSSHDTDQIYGLPSTPFKLECSTSASDQLHSSTSGLPDLCQSDIEASSSYHGELLSSINPGPAPLQEAEKGARSDGADDADQYGNFMLRKIISRLELDSVEDEALMELPEKLLRNGSFTFPNLSVCSLPPSALMVLQAGQLSDAAYLSEQVNSDKLCEETTGVNGRLVDSRPNSGSPSGASTPSSSANGASAFGSPFSVALSCPSNDYRSREELLKRLYDCAHQQRQSILSPCSIHEALGGGSDEALQGDGLTGNCKQPLAGSRRSTNKEDNIYELDSDSSSDLFDLESLAGSNEVADQMSYQQDTVSDYSYGF